MIGQTISHYKILAKIGEGGMGVVYRATDLKLDRDVALKFVKSDALNDRETRLRFIREAKAAASLDHSNVCTVHEIGESDGELFLSMAFIDGQSLKDRVADGPLPLDEALSLAAQAGAGLRAAHEKGIVHRDIKSANLMVTPEGQVKVMDFGLAQLAGQNEITRTHTTLGTAGYMSPEQAQAQPTDRRTDIWSLGVVLYEMLTGRLPFEGAVEAAVAYAVVNTEHQPPTALRTGLPVGIDRVISKALAKDREERYQYIEDMLVDLRALSPFAETPDLLQKRYRPRRKVQVSPRVVLAGTIVIFLLAWIAVRTLTDIMPIDSLAVLPFIHEGAEPSTEYLAEGISESIITALSEIPGLRVKSWDTTRRYREQDKTVQEFGRDLDVRAVLKGRLIERGDSLTVSVELVDANDGSVLWRNQYKRPLGDILAIDQEISQEISQQLRLRLTGTERQRLTDRPTRDPEAYRSYLQGRYHWNRRGESLPRSRDFFQQAVEQDPTYALAWSGLADSYLMLGAWSMMRPAEAYPRARAAARRAIEIEETLAEPHATLGYLKTLYEWDWPGAEREFRRAIELNPEYGTAHHWFAFYFLTVGSTEQALVEIRRAWELDPLSPIISAEVAYFYAFARDYQQAFQEARKVLELDPASPTIFGILGRVHMVEGNLEEAKAALERSLQLSQRSSIRLASTASALALIGNTEEARTLLRELLDRADKEYVFPSLLAQVYASLGENDRAFEYFDKALEERSLVASWLRDPWLDNLRSDPRFEELFERMGLEF